MNSAKIQSVLFYEAKSSHSQPIADATHDIPEIKFIICEIHLADGTIGQGHLLSFHFNPHALRGALKDLETFLKQGYRVHETKKLSEDYSRESEYFGQTGLLKWPLALVNLAMWDAWGKVNEKPVWNLLNGHRRKIPIYGSGGWLSYSDEELIEEVISYKKRGFQAVKIKVGQTELERDVERICKVRESIGPEMKLMIDANQGMQVLSAMKLVERVKDQNILWFEEPLDHTDFDGYQSLKAQSDLQLAMGEREFDTLALEILAVNDVLDIWQPDIIRIGGVEEWQKSALKAEHFQIKVAPHYYKDYDVPLLCTIQNGIAAESFDWIDDLIDHPLDIIDGYTLPRQGNGWGFSFIENKMSEIDL